MEWQVWTEQVLKRAKHVILFGELAELLGEKLTQQPYLPGLAAYMTRVTRVETIAEAVALARETAVAGDVVLLSPGGTSFDAFKDFAERGERFRELVNLL
jgi:UDP-N-acetylmuramoylalanine--D-glutamate ligase